MKTDVLSDVLRAVHLTGAVYFDFELSSPWVLEAPPAQAIAERVMPGAPPDADRLARWLAGSDGGTGADGAARPAE